MDLGDLSVSSFEDDMSAESDYSLDTNPESDNEGIDLSCYISEYISADNRPNRKKRAKNGLTKVSKLKVQKAGTEIQDDRSSISSTDKDSVGNETLKSPQSMLSVVSTDATFGSSSSEHFSLEEELSDDIGEIRDVYETQDDTESAVLRWLPKASMSDSPLTSSVFGAKLTNRSQKLDCLFTAADETSFVSDKSSDTKKLSIKNTTAPNLIEKAPSNNTREDEGCFETDGFYDHDNNSQNCRQTEDASVRRIVKTESSTSPETYSLPSTSYERESSVSNSSTAIGRSLLNIGKSVERNREDGENSQIYETFVDVKYSTPKPWVRELSTFSQQITNATNKILDTESLLKEVQHFFQTNRVEADVNLSWEKNKQIILTSRYFSDEFAKRHGLLTCEELVEERLKDLDRQTSLLRNKLRILQLCGILTEYNISEQEFIECFHHRLHDEGTGRDRSFGRWDPERFEQVDQQLHFIETEVDFDVMLELYKKLTMEGASFFNLLYKPKEPSAAEERFRCRELPSVSEYSSQVPHQFFSEDRSVPFNSYMLDRTVLRNSLNDTKGPSSEGSMTANEYATGSSSESKSNVLQCSIKDENQPCQQETSVRKAKKWPELSDE